MGGKVFVLFCATALVASIAPKINQQFIFIIPESKVLNFCFCQCPPAARFQFAQLDFANLYSLQPFHRQPLRFK